MTLVATLVSDPRAGALTPPLANRAAAAVGASPAEWLAEGEACEIALPHMNDVREAEARLREAVGDVPLDVIVQNGAGRRRRLLVADMDSTMIGQECIDELADEIGIKEQVAAITARAMNGEIAFEPALRERVALLRGLDARVIERIIATRITLAPGARELVRTMRANGAWTVLVSGGFDAFTSRIAEMIGFHAQQANTLQISEGRLTGTVVEPILGREAKARALRESAKRLGLSPSDALAVGDGANDLDMIRLAGMGVAIHAKPAVAAEARVRIDHGDLTALLYLQGYRRSEFVT